MGAANSKTLWTIGLGISALYALYISKNKGSGWIWNWGGPSSPKPIRGLRNIGSTCYLNAVLQALSSCVYFSTWLAYKDDENRCDFPPTLHHISEYKRFDYPMIAVLYRAVLVINRVIGNDIDDAILMAKVPNDLVQTLRNVKHPGNRFIDFREQDTFKMLQYLLTVLHLEVARSVFRRQKGTIESILDEDDASEVSGELISISETEPGSEAQASVMKSLQTSSSMVSTHSEGIPSAPASTSRPSMATETSSGWDIVNDPKKPVNRIYSKRKESISMDLNIPVVPKFPFRGLTANVLQCLQCLHKLPVRLEAFESLTLLMPSGVTGGPRILTIRSLLNELMKPTIVTQVDCMGCSLKQGKPMKSAFSKRMCIARFPPVLVFHILQSQWTSNTLSKRYETVNYEEYLNIGDLPDWIDILKSDASLKVAGEPQAALIQPPSRTKRINYKLRALIAHSGEAESGHFFTCRRIPETPQNEAYKWVFVSDDHVSQLEGAEPFHFKPYLLFYEKS